MKISTLFLVLLLITIITCSQRPKPVNLTEVNQVYDKPWYSGYLDFPFKNYSAHMHYFYFPSQSDTPQKDPLLFWFNGGPGCSSLLGALYQHGPFIFNDAFGFLVNNPQSWNKRANTVYIQSPAQVGFSYFFLDPQQSYPQWNDDMVAELNLQSILQFFNTYPEFQQRPTFIAGESYGGIYVPTVFYKLHKYNELNSDRINLKGFAVGNGCTDPSECQFLSEYPHYLYILFNKIGIIDDQLFQKAERQCLDQPQITTQCNDTMNQIDKLATNINIYDAYRPCWQNNGANFTNGQSRPYTLTQLRKLALRTGYDKQKRPDLKGWAPPCVDSEGIDNLLRYENRPALGIPEFVPAYSMCVIEDQFDYQRSQTGTYQIYKTLIPLNKYKFVIYSGDSDPAVPISGTLYWMQKIRKQLNLSTKTYWKHWFTKTSAGDQNSGSFWELSNQLSLVRFKGVGHMAPQWNNLGGTKLINYLLFDEPL